MTLREAAPYPSLVIRTLCLSLVASLTACATDQVSRAEHTEVLASLRALRAENARLESRLDKLETDQRSGRPVAAAPRAELPKSEFGSIAPKPGTPNETPREDLPSLTVVKLKPRKESPPKLPTAIEVVEPAPEVITNESAIAIANADEADASENTAVEQIYLQGLDAMKTGNSEGGIATLRQFARDWPKHPRADNALFYAAVALMAAREYQQAEALLEQTLKNYPAGDATLESMVKLAECKSRLNRPADARATWEKIVATYPGTQAALVAQSRLAASSAPPKE